MTEIEPAIAKAIMYKLGESGTPPEYGVEYFSVGLEPYLKVIQEEYLDGILKMRLSAFKLVIGSYGGGKTHFLYVMRDLAWKNNFAASYVPLSPTECPFDLMELVYKNIAANLMYPMGQEELMNPSERGIEAFIRIWFEKIREELKDDELLKKYGGSIKGIESTSFSNAVKGSFLALAENDEEKFSDIMQWLKGEGFTRHIHRSYGIEEELSKATAFRLIRSLCQWVHTIGYNGIVLLFDEAERAVSLKGSKGKRQALDNLRQLVDECGNSRIPGALIFYAIPDDNILLEGRSDVYEALRQRLRGVFSYVNPSGVRIELEKLEVEPVELMMRIGERLASVYEAAYSIKFIPRMIEDVGRFIAEAAHEQRFADVGYKRLFVKSFVEAAHSLCRNPQKKLSMQEVTGIVRGNLIKFERIAEEESEEDEF